MNLPAVTVLMPVYNGEEFLDQAIQSILSQSFKNFELLIINDGSTDKSLLIINSYDDARIRLIENERNLGLVKTRNKGIGEARGKYIAMLDCDDIALPDRLSLQVNFLEQSPDYGLVGSQIILIDKEGRKLGHETYAQDASDIPAILFFNNYLAQSSVLIRSALIKELQYREEYPPAEDYDLWVRLARISKIYIVQKPLVKYRIHTNNISLKKAADGAAAVKKILYHQLKYLKLIPTPSEFDLHISIANHKYEKSKVYIDNCALWLLKLYQANLNTKIYPEHVFKRVIVHRFILICGNSRVGLGALCKFFKFPLLNKDSFKTIDIIKLFLKTLSRR